MNTLLQRQIKKHLAYVPASEKTKMKAFFTAIEQAYEDAEKDRLLMERSLDISSEESLKVNGLLRQQVDKNQKTLTQIEEIIRKLEVSFSMTKASESIDLAKYLKQLVSDYQEASGLVRANETKLHAILYSIGDGLFVTDTKGIVQEFNDTAAEVSGFMPDEVIGTHYSKFLRFIDEKTGEAYKDFVSLAMEEKSVQKMNRKVSLISKTGEYVPIGDSAAPFRDENGEVVGCVVVFQDMTRLRTFERLKNEFCSITSHELRTPMTVIRGYLNLLLKEQFGPINERQKEGLVRMQKNVTQLIDLVNDMLDLSKLEEEKMDFNYEDISLNDCFGQVKEEFSEVLKLKKIRLSLLIKEDFMVRTDELKMIRILRNLIGNAHKFTPEGGRITLHAKLNPKNLKQVLISVKDTGVGMSKKDQERLFEKFYQVKANQGCTLGTGLGLSICKSMIEQMKGAIWVKSKKNQGSTFFFTVRLSKKVFNYWMFMPPSSQA